MLKHYHTIWISFIGVMAVGLSVTLSPQGLLSGQGLQGLVSSALASDDDRYGGDGYDEEGYDRKGHDRDGFDHEGYSHDGHDREGYDKEGYKDDGHHRDGHYESGRDHHKRHDRPTAGEAQEFKAKPTVKQY